MTDDDLIEIANQVPSVCWWNIEVLIDSAKSEETAERLRLIMIKKELFEQVKVI